MQVKKQQLEPYMEQQTGSKLGKEYVNAVLCLFNLFAPFYVPWLNNLYTESIMRNAGLEDTQARIKIARRNINNLRHADDTTLMAESKEELESLLMSGLWKWDDEWESER